MSFAALLPDRAHVYARSAGDDHWRRVTVEPLACRVTQLSLRDSERALDRLGAQVSHRARCLPDDAIQPGHRLKLDDGRSFLIVAVQKIGHPAPAGHLSLALAAVPDHA